ncbi:hypothetical protein GCM10020331_057650 [Ectobacillus funiculus]
MNRFYRVDKARTRKQGGNGLGLAIAKRLVNKYGGHIALDSVEGEGTTVSLSFPIFVKHRGVRACLMCFVKEDGI